ncbi:hypothetical protein CR513_40082, partial [Mucuna pruriens]
SHAFSAIQSLNLYSKTSTLIDVLLVNLDMYEDSSPTAATYKQIFLSVAFLNVIINIFASPNINMFGIDLAFICHHLAIDVQIKPIA